MTHLSTTADLSFLSIPAGCTTFREVALPGAELGDKVTLEEPFQRPAGITMTAHVSQPGTVKVWAKNKTGEAVSVPSLSYRVSINR